MADMIQTPIITLKPVGTEDINADWMVVTRRGETSDAGVARGRVTVRKKYPSGGTGITVDDDGVVTADIDDDTIKVDRDGKLYSIGGKSDPAYLRGTKVANRPLRVSSGIDDLVRLPIVAEEMNAEFTCDSGVVYADERVNWVGVDISMTVESPDYEDSMYIIPVTIVVNGVARTYSVDTTERFTTIDHRVSLYSGDREVLPISIYAYKDASDEDSAAVNLTIGYQATFSGV